VSRKIENDQHDRDEKHEGRKSRIDVVFLKVFIDGFLKRRIKFTLGRKCWNGLKKNKDLDYS